MDINATLNFVPEQRAKTNLVRECARLYDPAIHTGSDFREIERAANRFKHWLTAKKSEVPQGDFDWYRYDSMSSIPYIGKLVQSPRLLQLGAGLPMLDIGCQDGDLTYFFESLGCDVTAFDNPTTNFNRMLGVRALHQHLGSSVRLHTVDLDSQFSLRGRFGLCLLLGVLYHLKNPFYVLEAIAKSARYCLLSTRIARIFPPDHLDVGSTSAAYLLRDRELNDDATNYWVFSHKGLTTLLERTHWEVCASITAGDSKTSDPISESRDERIFCLLRSRLADRSDPVELLTGWHDLEEGGFRWVQRKFSLRVTGERGASGLSIECYVPALVIDEFRGVTIRIMVNGEFVCETKFGTSGRHVLLCPIHKPAGSYLVELESDHFLPADENDHRERSIVVGAISIE